MLEIYGNKVRSLFLLRTCSETPRMCFNWLTRESKVVIINSNRNLPHIVPLPKFSIKLKTVENPLLLVTSVYSPPVVSLHRLKEPPLVVRIRKLR